MAKVAVKTLLLLLLGSASSCGDGAQPTGRLLFNGGICSIDGGPRCGLFVLDPDGKNLTQITDVVGLSPQWSPDGKHLAMVTFRPGSGDLDQRSELTVLNADGTGRRGVAVGVAWESAECQPFAWSPDGSEIAFEAAPWASSGGQAYNLSVVDAHTGQIRELAGGVSARAPVWYRTAHG